MTKTMQKKGEINAELAEKAQAFLKNTGDDWNYIIPTALKVQLMEDNDLFLLDTRKPEDFAKGHIKGATNIFWLDIAKPENLKKLPQNKRIIVCCYVGHTASQVLVLLSLLGFDVRALKFGMGQSPAIGVPVAGWVNYGFETV